MATVTSTVKLTLTIKVLSITACESNCHVDAKESNLVHLRLNPVMQHVLCCWCAKCCAMLCCAVQVGDPSDLFRDDDRADYLKEAFPVMIQV